MIADAFVDIEQAVVDRFRAQITLGGDGGDPIPTIDPNAPGEPPAGSGVFADLTVQFARSQASIGSYATARKRSVGLAIVGLNAPAGSGKASLKAVASRVAQAFEGQTVSGVVFRTATPSNGSGERSGGHWRVVVSLPFYADD